MKRTRVSFSALLLSVFLSALAAFSAQMCLVQAFSLSCDTLTLLILALASAIVCTAVFLLPRAGLISGLAAVLGLAILVFFREPLLETTVGFVYAVTKVYARAFPSISPYGAPCDDLTALLAILGVPLAWFTARTVCREGSVLLVLLGCMPILILCLIIVNIAPVLWLVLLTAVILILLVSQGIRDRNASEGSYLGWWLVLPTVILIAGITVLWPPAAYERAQWSRTLQTLAEAKLPFEPSGSAVSAVIHRWNPTLKRVNLSVVGPKIETGVPVLKYKADTNLSLLRGVSLGIYEDNTWSAVPEEDYQEMALTLNPLTMTGWAMPWSQNTLWVQTLSEHANFYTPYGMLEIPAGSEAVDDAYVRNTDDRTSYTVSYRQMTETMTASSSLQIRLYSSFVEETYTQVPEELQAPLAAIAEDAGLTDLTREQLPWAVAQYVKRSGVYDLNTPRTPAGEDFVLYFLEESHQGYCVHFASAAAMLLRSLDVPARYVTGYSVSGTVQNWNTVTEDEAHAWVEYYVEGIGWLPLDPTPSADDPVPDVSVDPTLPPEETTPDVPDQPQPSEPDTPSDTPKPEDTPAAPDTPQEQQPSDVQPQTPAIRISPAWLWLLVPVGLIALLLLRRKLVSKHRTKRFTTGHPNRQALSMWRILLPMSRHSGVALTEELLQLAEKARFSQHTLTQDELNVFRDAIAHRTAILSKHRVWKRLWYRFGLVLY